MITCFFHAVNNFNIDGNNILAHIVKHTSVRKPFNNHNGVRRHTILDQAYAIVMIFLNKPKH